MSMVEIIFGFGIGCLFAVVFIFVGMGLGYSVAKHEDGVILKEEDL